MSIDFRPDDPRVGWDDPLNLNVANGNAARILEVLGLPPSSEGEIDPVDLTARILVARLADDTGSPDTEEPRRPGDTRTGRWITCGLRPGYFADRLDALDRIAEHALANDTKVVWY